MRFLRNDPGFALAAVVTLALGIGANSAIFSVVPAALLRPLPYDEPDRIFSVEVVIPQRRDSLPSVPPRVQDFLAWRRAPTAFSAIAAQTPAEWNLTGTGDPQRVGGARVSANYFSFLGVPLAHGRAFLPEEETPGRDRVVIVSDALWRSRYGANPALLNNAILLNGDSHLVVGIAPPSLLVPTGTMLHPSIPFAARVDIWKPIAPTPSEREGESWNHGVLVRLKPGESAGKGRAQLQVLLNESLRAVVPELKTDFQTTLVPIREIYAGTIRLRLLLVLGAASLLLLAACANVANLSLGRVASRSREFAIRAALGASRTRILGQVLAESTSLALIRGALAIALAWLGVPALLAQGPRDLVSLAATRPTLPVLAVTLLASVATVSRAGSCPHGRRIGRTCDPCYRKVGATTAATVGARRSCVRHWWAWRLR